MTDQLGLLRAVEEPGTNPLGDKPLRLLLVEDNPGDARLVQEAFRQQSIQSEADWQYEIEVVPRLKEAIDALRNEQFDLALLDLGLPDSQGMETIRQIRAMNAYLPIVVLTGNADQETAMRSMRAGAEDYLVKGEFDSELLTRTVRYSLERSRLAKIVEQEAAANKRILSSLSAHIAVLNPEGVIVRTNQAWDQFSRANGGKPEGTGIGTNYLEVVRQAAKGGVAGAEIATKCIQEVISGSSDFEELEYPCHSPTEQRWFTMRVTPLREANQEGIVIAHENITDRRQAENQLQHRTQELGTILAHAPDIVARYDLDGRHLYISPSIEHYSGRPPEYYIGKTDEELEVPAERAELWSRSLRQVIETGSDHVVEYQTSYLDEEDELQKFQAKLVPEIGLNGEIQSIVVVARDITEVKNAQELAEARERVLAAVSFTARKLLVGSDWESALPEVLSALGESVDVHRAYVWKNKISDDGELMTSQFAEWAASPELALQDSQELQAASYEALGFERWRQVLAGDGVVQGPLDEFPPKEREFLSQQSIQSLLVVPIFAENKWWGFLGFDDVENGRHWDPSVVESLKTAAASLGAAISSRRGLDALERRERRFRSMVQNASDIITIVEADGTVVYESPALEHVMGFKPEDVVGLNVFDPVYPEDRPAAEAQFQDLVDDPNKSMQVDIRLFSASGEQRVLEVVGTNLLDDPAVNGVVLNSRDITDRRQAEFELTQREQQYRLLAENSIDVIWQMDKRFNFTYVSPSVEELFGYSPEEYLGTNLSDHTEWKHYYRLAKAALRSSQQYPSAESILIEIEMADKAGHPIEVEISAGPAVDNAGNLVGIQGMTRDIRDRKQADRELRASERRLQRERDLFEMLTETSPIAITLLDQEGNITFANKEAENVLELSKSDITDREYNNPDWKIEDYEGGLFPQEELPFVQAVIRKEPVYDVRHAIRMPDGKRKLLSINVAPVLSEKGEVSSVVANILDITQQVQAEQKLRASEERYRQLFTTIKDGIVTVDENRRITQCNPGFANMFGYSIDEMVGENSRFLYATRATYESVGEKARKAVLGSIEYSDVHLVRKNGEEFFAEISAETLYDDQGNRIGNVGVFRDVTERLKAQQALRSSEERFRSLFGSIRDAILVADVDRNISQCNPAFTEVFGYTEEEIRGKPTSYIYKDLEEFRHLGEQIQEMRKGGLHEARTITVRYRRKSGEIFSGETAIYTLQNLAGEPVGNIGLIRDVTDRERRLKEQHAIAQVAEALREAATREQMPPIILGQLLDLLDAGGAEMGLTNKQQDRLWVELGVGSWEQFTGLELGPENFAWEILHGDDTFQTEDLHTVENFTSAESLEKDRAAIAVSMKAGQVPVGIIWVARETPFNSDDIGLLRSIADMAGNALQRAGLHEETQERAKQMSAVSLLGQALAEQLDEFAIYERLVEGTKRLLPGISTVIVARYRQEQELFHCVYGEHDGDLIDVGELQPVPLLPPGKGSQSEAVHRRKPVILHDLSEMVECDPNSIRGEGGRSTASALYVPMMAEGKVIGVIQAQSYTEKRFTKLDGQIMRMVANTAAIALENADLLRETQGSAIELAMAYDTTLEGWAKALELRDKETEGHTRRVTDLTVRLAANLGLPADNMVNVRRGALMHDIGKMGIPDSILLKPGKLTEDEWEIMRGHPQMAYDMLKQVYFLRQALTIPLYHHERWDGSGYPEGLTGEEIPLEARIFAVVDVYDALSSDRPYREAWPPEKVQDYLKEKAGVEFDPQVVDAFFEILNFSTN